MALLRIFPPRWRNRRRTPVRSWLALCVLLPLLGAPDLAAQTTRFREDQIKAVFLFNFAQFVEWPPAAFLDPQAPLVIGVLGEDPFGAALDETVRDEKIGQRPLVVRRYRRAEEIDQCHILFISESETGRLEEIITRSKGRSMLTVCDTEGFAKRGVMIRLITEKNKIRLHINLDAAKAAGLTISSKLLRPAEIVTTGKD